MSLYQIRVEDINNNVHVLEEYKGKVLLIVNTATECFFTPQYEGLQSLYNMFHERGFEVLDFPCNQFGKQAPGSIEDIDKFCVKTFEKNRLTGKILLVIYNESRLGYNFFMHDYWYI